jgi:hypothetical protein
MAGAVKQHIEDLALAATLRKEDYKLREEFKDLFEAIPHVDNLPTVYRLSGGDTDQRSQH